MAETAGATGTAHGAQAMTGPPLPSHREIAQAIADAAQADLIVEQVRAKVAKAELNLELQDARLALEEAQANAARAHERLAGIGPDVIAAAAVSLGEDAAKAQELFEQVQRLAGEAGD